MLTRTGYRTGAELIFGNALFVSSALSADNRLEAKYVIAPELSVNTDEEGFNDRQEVD